MQRAHLVLSINDKQWRKRGCFSKLGYFSFPLAYKAGRDL